MKFHDFLESSHVSTNIQLQLDYHPLKQAKIQAGHNLIKLQRGILTVFMYPVLLVNYLLVLTHLKAAPPSPQALVEAYKAQAIAKAQAENPGVPVIPLDQATRDQAVQRQLERQKTEAATDALQAELDKAEVKDPTSVS